MKFYNIKCIDATGCELITLNKVYTYATDCSETQYEMYNDKGYMTSYFKHRFKIVDDIQKLKKFIRKTKMKVICIDEGNHNLIHKGKIYNVLVESNEYYTLEMIPISNLFPYLKSLFKVYNDVQKLKKLIR